MNTYSLIGILKFKNNLQNISMSPIKSFMAWYNATGKENHKSLFEKPLKDRCGFCGETKVIKCNMAIVFSEFEGIYKYILDQKLLPDVTLGY